MRLIASLKQRISDWRRERRIRALCAAALTHARAGENQLAREALSAAAREREFRSDAQLTRIAIAELKRHPELARAQILVSERRGRQP